jgi:hypothetical protein
VTPTIGFVSPVPGELLNGTSRVELDFVLPPSDELEGIYFGVDDEQPALLRDFGGELFVKSQNFENGEHSLTVEMRAIDGEIYRDTVVVLFDNPDHALLGVTPEKSVVKNGEEVLLRVEYSSDEVILKPDFSELDSEFHAADPQIEIRTTLSTDNTQPDGEHFVVLTALDPEGRETTHRIALRLENTPRLPVLVKGGTFVNEASETLPHGTEGAPSILEVSASGTLLSGNTVELEVTFDQDPSAPVDRLLVALDSFSGYFVVPIEAAFEEEVVSTTVSLELPAFLPSVFPDNEGQFNVRVAAPNSVGQIAEWATQGVLSIFSGSGGVQVSLTWDTPVDLDLSVQNPDWEFIDYANTATDGGVLDVDSNRMCEIDGKNAENISWQPGLAKPGVYEVYATLYDDCGETTVNWQLSARFCGQEHHFQGTFDRSNASTESEVELVTSFDVDCTQFVQGVATYDKVGDIRSSDGAVIPRPIAFAPVNIRVPGSSTPVGTTMTNERGEYLLSFAGEFVSEYFVEVEASWFDPTFSGSEPRARVTPFSDDQAYTYRSATFQTSDAPFRYENLHATVTNNSGAFNIREIMMRSYNWLSVHAPSSESKALSALRAKWERGVAAPEGVSTATQTAVRVNGTQDDQDEWDDSVLAHEFMHFAFANLGHTPLPTGPHNGRVGPALAFSEGLATALGQQVLGRSLYESETQTLYFNRDLEVGMSFIIEESEQLIAYRGADKLFFDTSDHRATGDVSEYLVAMVLWDLMDDSTAEIHDHLGKRKYTTRVLFDPPESGSYVDRDGNGVDLVDFLDHFRAGLTAPLDNELYCLTSERKFPYDAYSSNVECP